MRAAYDEIITQAGKRGHAPERVVGDLLAAQLADVESRATAYRMGNAKFPVLKTPAEFDLTASPVNAAMVRDLHQSNCLTDSRNAVLIGGAGSGETHLAIAIAANCVREHEARVRFFNTVDLVNQLEVEARGRQGRSAGLACQCQPIVLGGGRRKPIGEASALLPMCFPMAVSGKRRSRNSVLSRCVKWRARKDSNL